MSGYIAPGPRKLPRVYEGLCQKVLQNRLKYLFASTLAATWTLLGLASAPWGWRFWRIFALLVHIISPLAMASTVLAFVIGILPLIVIQKMTVTSRPQQYATLRSQIQTLLRTPSAWRTLAFFILSSLPLTLSYVFLASGTTRISVFMPTTMYPWHLNERFVFLMAGNLVMALVIGARTLLKQRWNIQWPLEKERDQKVAFARRFIPQLRDLVQLSLSTSCLFLAVYLTFRPLIFGAILSLPFTKPFIYNFLRSRLWGLSVSIYFRLAALNLASTLLWSFSEVAFGVTASMPMSVAKHSVKPLECILSGMNSQSTKEYFQHFAIYELSELSTDPRASARRKAIFSDLRNPSSASAWGIICRELLVVLGKDYQNLVSRGKPKVAPAALTSAPKTPAQAPRTPTVLRKAQYAALQRSPTDKLLDGLEYSINTADAAFGQLSKSLSATSIPAPASLASISASTSHLSIMPSSSDLSAVANKLSSSTSTMVKSAVPSPVHAIVHSARAVYASLGEETADRKLRICLPNVEEDVWAVKALCNLTAASFTEDPYGSVQRDLPKILEALLLMQQAVKDFTAEMDSFECDDWSRPLGEELGTGLHTVITTFHDSLSAFRFPPRIAKMLQDVVDVR